MPLIQRSSLASALSLFKRLLHDDSLQPLPSPQAKPSDNGVPLGEATQGPSSSTIVADQQDTGYDSDCDSCLTRTSSHSSTASDLDNGLGKEESCSNRLPVPESSTPKSETRKVSSSAAPQTEEKKSQAQALQSSSQTASKKDGVLDITLNVPMIPFKSVVREQQLGWGSSGHVYRVRVAGDARQFALKVVKLPMDPKKRQLVLRDVYIECHFMVQAKGHPNVVQLHGLVPHPKEEEIGVLMELCDQGDVLDYLAKRKPLTEEMARQWLSQAASALAYLHQLGIQHRDVKPENIFLCTTPQGIRAKIGDFGLSRQQLPGGYALQLGGEFACTDIYAAPEVLLRKKTTSFPADMWGLGITAFVMLGGYHPFDKTAKGYGIEMRNHVLANAWSFDESPWTKVAYGAMDFIAGLLRADPSKRLSSNEALQHFWLRV